MATRLLDPDLLAKIGNLSVRARAVVDGVLTGLHKSPHHGSSIEFAEHKEYAPGDEVRHIDWKAYGRLDRYYVKKFEDETNLRCALLLDASTSMAYGDGEEQKLAHARTLAAAFAYLLLRQQDAPGLSVFRERIDLFVPPRAKTSHFNELAEALVRSEAEGGTDLAAAVEQTAERLQGRNLVVVFSDFFDTQPEVLRLLARLKTRKNDVVLFHVLHGDELDFPFEHLSQFEDMESDTKVLADPVAIAAEYRRVFGAFVDDLRTRCLSGGIDYVLARSDRPPAEALLAFLLRRERAV